MILNVDLKENSYDIVVERGILNKAEDYLNLNRRVLVVTDDLVPETYADTICSKCKTAVKVTVKSGEQSKSIECFEKLLKIMLENNFSRKDAVVAVGGGVVGDLAGFVSACYMRGVDFYNIPTTLLSQVDSSIGGKTAVNLEGVKNIIGAFYQPKKVLIDSDLLKTLPKRQFANGLAEAIKVSLTSDKELFELLETKNIEENIDEIIIHALEVKRKVVIEDEKEQGLRKILNFGHTIGHGIESQENLTNLYHGECVALGMLPMCSEKVRERLLKVLEKANLPTTIEINMETVLKAIMHDKKADGDKISVTVVNEVGEFEIKTVTHSELEKLANEVF